MTNYDATNTTPETKIEPDCAATNAKPDCGNNQEKTKTKPDQETLNPRLNLNECFTFDVGYSKPPRDSWYAPGTSGNPGGRPKGSKNKPKELTDRNFNEILRSEIFKPVRLKGGNSYAASAARAVTQSMIDLAIGGNLRAMQLVFASIRAVEAADAAQQEADYNYALAYKARWDSPLLMFDGESQARAVPSPRDVVLDHRNRRAMFTGARNEEEMFKHLAGKDLQEEDTEEVNNARDNMGNTNDEYPIEKLCEPLPERTDVPYEGDDERLPKHAPDEERLRTPTPFQPTQRPPALPASS